MKKFQTRGPTAESVRMGGAARMAERVLMADRARMLAMPARVARMERRGWLILPALRKRRQ